MNHLKDTVNHLKISWDPDRRIAQVWKHDNLRGWFRGGWGLDVQKVAQIARATGYQVQIVEHAEMLS